MVVLLKQQQSIMRSRVIACGHSEKGRAAAVVVCSRKLVVLAVGVGVAVGAAAVAATAVLGCGICCVGGGGRGGAAVIQQTG